MRILLCTDGSPAAANAVRFGLNIARHSDEPIALLGVVEKRDEIDELRAGLEALGAELQIGGAQCDIKIRHGHAAEQILDEAEKWPADLIVVGQLGRRGLTRFLMGGTATRIVQYAPCSVLLVKARRARSAENPGLHGGRRTGPARCGNGRSGGATRTGRRHCAARHVASAADR